MNAITGGPPDRGNGGGRLRPRFLALGLIGLAIFAIDTLAALQNSYLPFDIPIERFVQGAAWGPLMAVFQAFDWLEGWRQQVVAVGAIALVAAINWRAAPLMVVGALSGTIYFVTQASIHRPRPSPDLVHVIRHTDSFSYPSGHVVFFSSTMLLLIACVGVGRLPRGGLGGLWVVAGLVLAIACVGRVDLGEHWPSDVLGGLALGLGWTCLALSVRPLSNPVLERRG